MIPAPRIDDPRVLEIVRKAQRGYADRALAAIAAIYETASDDGVVQLSETAINAIAGGEFVCCSVGGPSPESVDSLLEQEDDGVLRVAQRDVDRAREDREAKRISEPLDPRDRRIGHLAERLTAISNRPHSMAEALGVAALVWHIVDEFEDYRFYPADWIDSLVAPRGSKPAPEATAAMVECELLRHDGKKYVTLRGFKPHFDEFAAFANTTPEAKG